MKSAPCRKFTLADAMMLVAAVAVSSCLLKYHYEELRAAGSLGFPSGWLRLDIRTWSDGDVISSTVWCLGWTYCWLVPCTIACLIVRLRHPRPRLRRLILQRGAASIVLATIFTAATVTLFALRKALFASSGTHLFLGYGLERLIGGTGLLIVGAWLLLALSGRCRAEPGWIDRTGTFLGGCWVASWFARYLLTLWYGG